MPQDFPLSPDAGTASASGLPVTVRLSAEIWGNPEGSQSHLERPYTKALFARFDRALPRPVTAGGLRFIGVLAFSR